MLLLQLKNQIKQLEDTTEVNQSIEGIKARIKELEDDTKEYCLDCSLKMHYFKTGMHLYCRINLMCFKQIKICLREGAASLLNEGISVIAMLTTQIHSGKSGN